MSTAHLQSSGNECSFVKIAEIRVLRTEDSNSCINQNRLLNNSVNLVLKQPPLVRRESNAAEL